MHTIAKYYITWFFLLKRMLQTYAINHLFIFDIQFIYKQIKIQKYLTGEFI
jgi:hypothetical protein